MTEVDSFRAMVTELVDAAKREYDNRGGGDEPEQLIGYASRAQAAWENLPGDCGAQLALAITKKLEEIVAGAEKCHSRWQKYIDASGLSALRGIGWTGDVAPPRLDWRAIRRQEQKDTDCHGDLPVSTLWADAHSLARQVGMLGEPETKASPITAPRVTTRRRPSLRGPLKLTAKEKRVGELLANGHSQKQIAGEMKVSKGRVSQLLRGVTTKTAAMARFAVSRESVQARKLPEGRDGEPLV